MIYPADKIIEHFKLKGRGQNAPRLRGDEISARCPFPHGYDEDTKQPLYESNPSFGINLKTGHWNCFSCQKRGRTLDDLAWKLNLDLPDIYKVLETNTYKAPKDDIKNYDISFFRLNQDKAEAHLSGRGIVGVAKKYDIGMSDDETMLYVPILDRKGDLYAWMEKNLEYSNWYLKPDEVDRDGLLYGAHEKFSGHGFLVESTTDKLILASWGFNAVATCSANVVPNQAELIADCFESVTLIPHNDTAGDKWVVSTVNSLFDKVLLYGVVLPKIYKDTAEIPNKETFEQIISKRRMIKRKFDENIKRNQK